MVLFDTLQANSMHGISNESTKMKEDQGCYMQDGALIVIQKNYINLLLVQILFSNAWHLADRLPCQEHSYIEQNSLYFNITIMVQGSCLCCLLGTYKTTIYLSVHYIYPCSSLLGAYTQKTNQCTIQISWKASFTNSCPEVQKLWS